jgi:hypothetical protein
MNTTDLGKIAHALSAEGLARNGENRRAGQQAFYHRARCDCAAAQGKYSNALESEPFAA